VAELQGRAGRFRATVLQRPRSVDIDKCTGCGDCYNNCLARNKISIPEKTSVVPRLDPEMKKTLDAILQPAVGRRGSLLGVLHDVQSAFNYLPADALRYVSERLGVPFSEAPPAEAGGLPVD